MKRLLFILLPIGVLAVMLAVTLPPRPRALPVASTLPPSARGAIHIHTRRYDGSGTPDDIAAAAARGFDRFAVARLTALAGS